MPYGSGTDPEYSAGVCKHTHRHTGAWHLGFAFQEFASKTASGNGRVPGTSEPHSNQCQQIIYTDWGQTPSTQPEFTSKTASPAGCGAWHSTWTLEVHATADFKSIGLQPKDVVEFLTQCKIQSIIAPIAVAYRSSCPVEQIIRTRQRTGR